MSPDHIMPSGTRSTNPDDPNGTPSTNPELPPRRRGQVRMEYRTEPVAAALKPELVTLLPAPTPTEIRAARAATGQSQTEAAAIVGHSRWQTWSDWEGGVKPMPALTWTWYLLATGQHPRARLVKRR